MKAGRGLSKKYATGICHISGQLLVEREVSRRIIVMKIPKLDWHIWYFYYLCMFDTADIPSNAEHCHVRAFISGFVISNKARYPYQMEIKIKTI